jgi:hypothetical protein
VFVLKEMASDSLFQHFSIVLPFVDNLVCFLSVGMVRGMLEPHLRNGCCHHNFRQILFFNLNLKPFIFS